MAILTIWVFRNFYRRSWRRSLRSMAGRMTREYLPAADPSFDVLYRLRPQKALQWKLSEYENSQQRWTASLRP